MHSAQELVANIDALTSLPTVYLRIREELDAPESSMTRVAGIISADPALTTRLLHVVNSALYGYGGKIDTIPRAVTILGLQQVHDLVLAMSLGSVFAGIRPAHMDMNRFWRSSVMCGIGARDIGRRSDLPSSERLLVVGLLADIGHLVMYQVVPALADEARTIADATEEPLHEVERRIVGCDHAEVGAALMDQWRLPSCFAEIIGAQINPRLAGAFTLEASIIHLANQIVESDRRGEASEVAAARVPPVIWSQVNLPPSSFAELRETAELGLAGYLALFFPKLND